MFSIKDVNNILNVQDAQKTMQWLKIHNTVTKTLLKRIRQLEKPNVSRLFW